MNTTTSPATVEQPVAQRLSFWASVNHQFWDLLRLVGLRDRLRCPMCSAVGAWKPHGGWLDVHDARKVRRWLCKWCGHYVGPEGVVKAGIDFEKGHWSLEADYRPMEHSPTKNIWFG